MGTMLLMITKKAWIYMTRYLIMNYIKKGKEVIKRQKIPIPKTDKGYNRDIEKALGAWIDYTNLSKLLFCGTDDSPYNINEIKADNQFYCDAKAISSKMGIEWESMTHQESNRVMLGLLEHYY